MASYERREPMASDDEIAAAISELNRLDCEHVEFDDIVEKVRFLFDGLALEANVIEPGTKLYRGRQMDSAPKHIRELYYPPPEYVNGFQRCNRPGKPLFYASGNMATLLSEIKTKVGSTVYISEWVTTAQLFCFYFPFRQPQKNITGARVQTFVENRFSQPIHETFSSQYKITAAISSLIVGEDIGFADSAENGPKLGGLIYPSVAHPARSENVALVPQAADNSLKLLSVTSFKIVSVENHEYKFEELDFCSNFSYDIINWKGYPGSWQIKNLPAGGEISAIFDGYTWQMIDHAGNAIPKT